jgi:hypothetical protein
MSFFRTYKKSELKSVHGAEPGEQRWPFVQVGLPTPIYLMQLERAVEEDATIGYEILTADLAELVNFSEGRYPPLRLVSVDLLISIPPVSRRTFHALREVWVPPQGGAYRFIVDDQVTLDFNPLQNRFDADALQCIFRAPAA